MISLIAAMSENRVIGVNNDLPWDLPSEMQYFYEQTINKKVLMGRKTFESMDSQPLSNRENYVFTSKDISLPKGVHVIRDAKRFLEPFKQSGEEVFVIGGAQLYQYCIPWADRIYLTIIHQTFQGDTFFPNFSEDDFQVTSQIKVETDHIPYTKLIYEKKL